MRPPRTARPGRLPALLVMALLSILTAGGLWTASIPAGSSPVAVSASRVILQSVWTATPAVPVAHRVRVAAAGRAPSTAGVQTAQRLDRSGAGQPLPLWAPATVVPAGPPPLVGQLPRPPTNPDTSRAATSVRGRAPPGPAGT